MALRLRPIHGLAERARPHFDEHKPDDLSHQPSDTTKHQPPIQPSHQPLTATSHESAYAYVPSPCPACLWLSYPTRTGACRDSRRHGGCRALVSPGGARRRGRMLAALCARACRQPSRHSGMALCSHQPVGHTWAALGRSRRPCRRMGQLSHRRTLLGHPQGQPHRGIRGDGATARLRRPIHRGP